MRSFAASSDASQYQAVDQEKWYTPNNAVTGRTVLFDADATKERKFAPWEVKDTTVKHAFIMGVVYMWDHIFSFGQLYGLVQILLCGNYVKTVYGFMGTAVTKVTLLEGGKQVEFTLGKTTGKSVVVDIKDIKK